MEIEIDNGTLPPLEEEWEQILKALRPSIEPMPTERHESPCPTPSVNESKENTEEPTRTKRGLETEEHREANPVATKLSRLRKLCEFFYDDRLQKEAEELIDQLEENLPEPLFESTQTLAEVITSLRRIGLSNLPERYLGVFLNALSSLNPFQDHRALAANILFANCKLEGDQDFQKSLEALRKYLEESIVKQAFLEMDHRTRLVSLRAAFELCRRWSWSTPQNLVEIVDLTLREPVDKFHYERAWLCWAFSRVLEGPQLQSRLENLSVQRSFLTKRAGTHLQILLDTSLSRVDPSTERMERLVDCLQREDYVSGAECAELLLNFHRTDKRTRSGLETETR